MTDDSSHPKDHYLSDSSSTMTNEGESTFDTSPEHQPVRSRSVPNKNRGSPFEDSDNADDDSSEHSTSAPGAGVLVVSEQQEVPPASPPPSQNSPREDEELEILKQQGAIPKHYRRPLNSSSVEGAPSLSSNQGKRNV